MSQPADEVTGSQEVGSSHSQLMVPLAPPAAADAADVLPAELVPQAASTEIAMTEAAAAAIRRVRRGLSWARGRERVRGMAELRNRADRGTRQRTPAGVMGEG